MKRRWLKYMPRLVGVALLAFLLFQLDIANILSLLGDMSWSWMLLAAGLYLPHLGLKAYRWRYLLRRYGVHYPFADAFLAYLGGVFVGLFTPGRLGEFIKAVHTVRDCDMRPGESFGLVLVDRLFDLSMLVAVGLMTLYVFESYLLTFGTVLLLVAGVIVAVAFRRAPDLRWIRRHTSFLGRFSQILLKEGGWLSQVHHVVHRMTWGTILSCAALTVGAYALYFLQCYFAGRALQLPVGFLGTSAAIALGSLVALLPFSVSGIGTRDAAIVAYLSTYGVSLDQSVAFSVAIFVIFYGFGGLIGGVCWLIKPVSLRNLSDLFKNETNETGDGGAATPV